MGLVAAYLLDIEGTTTPIDFVTKTLFPFARTELARYVSSHDVSQDLTLLADEYRQDMASGNKPPPWEQASNESVLPYLEWLMDRDRKSTGLKSIQGKIWQEGYASGQLKGVVYPDVPRAFRRWKDAGKKISIYSSGSVLAQELIFGHLDVPLTPLIDGYFDTEVGGKRASSSYTNIAQRVGLRPEEILFLSDIIEEIEAAKESGMQAIQVVRDGQAQSCEGCVANFDGLN